MIHLRPIAPLIALLLAGCVEVTTPPQRQPQPGSVFGGRVVAVTDGDTIKVLDGTQEIRVRLSGIDCPELGQPFGKAAKQFASIAAFGKTVAVDVVELDRYGRTVGVVILPDGTKLNHKLVEAGLAWWYQKYAPDDARLEALELEAKAAKRGLWADANPVPPWDWRRGTRPESFDPAAGGYWLSPSGVRHNSTCRHFWNTRDGRKCKPDDGRPCNLCGG